MSTRVHVASIAPLPIQENCKSFRLAAQQRSAPSGSGGGARHQTASDLDRHGPAVPESQPDQMALKWSGITAREVLLNSPGRIPTEWCYRYSPSSNLGRASPIRPENLARRLAELADLPNGATIAGDGFQDLRPI
jgi:hypothetical protein